jgi:hypothetical protein
VLGPQPTTNSGAGGGGGNAAAETADIPDADRDVLLREAGNVIAVQGIKDDTVSQLSQPSEAQYAPSIPTLGPAGTGSNGEQGIEQLKQMAAQGKVPDLKTLQDLVMGSH